MKKRITSLIVLVFFFTTFIACDKEDVEPNEQETLINNLSGTWKAEYDNYWYQMVFNKDQTGNRTDADNENDDFTYSVTKTKINFKTGFPLGEFEYKLIDNNQKLVLFFDSAEGDTLSIQK